MRTSLLGLLLFAAGLTTGLLLFSPGAGARVHVIAGTLTGSVGSSGNPDAFAISLSESSVAAGDYTFDITDYATIHNFDLINPSGTSVHATSISGTGSVAWTVTLTPGTWTYRCDMHHSLSGTLTVTGGTTSTSTSISTSTSTSTSTSKTTTTATTATTATATAPTTTQQTTTTGTGGGSKPLSVHIVSVQASENLVVVTFKTNQLTRAVVTLTRRGKRLARAARDSLPKKQKLRLKPGHTLAPGRYVLRVHVACCGTSASATKTIRIS